MVIERLLAATAKVVIAAGFVAVIGVFCAYWWSNTPPNRPREVAASAVWLWAPALGLPAPKRGVWVGCMVNQQDKRVHCQTNDKNGRLEFEGIFAPQTDHGSTADVRSMEIDVEKMSFSLSVFIDSELVPLVALKNGEVLIPAVAFDRGLKVLNAHPR
jgi:hypothetical protein